MRTLEHRFVVGLLLALLCLLGPPAFAADEDAEGDAAPDSAEYDPIERYDVRTMQGWEVYVHRDLLEREELAADAVELLEHRLADVRRRVPEAAVEKLQQVKIWLEHEHPTHPKIHYHVSPGWLAANDFHPEKVRSVEIGSARRFLNTSGQQPAVILHELAHAWHHQFLPDGYGNDQIRSAYERAVESGDYDEVLHIAGHTTEHYALTNPMEYFAEASEAYFATNDFYPFVRAELQEHDPRLFELLGELWHRTGE